MSDQLSSFGASDSGLLNMFVPWTPASRKPRESKVPEQVPPPESEDSSPAMAKSTSATSEEAALLAELDERMANTPLPEGFMSRVRSWVREL